MLEGIVVVLENVSFSTLKISFFYVLRQKEIN